MIRRATIQQFSSRIRQFQSEIEQAVGELNWHYDEMRRAARNRMGDLFNPSDYPATLEGQFRIEHDFLSVEPPPYLQQLNADLYREECQRMQSRFEEAVQLAEQAFHEELARLIEHLTERQSVSEDGQPKVFRDSAVTNLTEFFERFRLLNIRSNPELDELIASAQRIVRGSEPQSLRDSQSLRQHVSSRMAAVQADLDQLLIGRPYPPRADCGRTSR